MRLWSIHPRYLDQKGLVALWREALLAQKIICGGSSSYARHPQMKRFLEAENPRATIAAYLIEIWREGRRRGYKFDRGRIIHSRGKRPMSVTKGQMEFERQWLKSKLERRCPSKLRELREGVECHPLFFMVEGDREEWEKGKLEDDKISDTKRYP